MGPRVPSDLEEASPGLVLPSSLPVPEACVVCFDCPPGGPLRPCGHASFCSGCARRFESCPLCRTPIEGAKVAWRKMSHSPRSPGAPFLAVLSLLALWQLLFIACTLMYLQDQTLHSLPRATLLLLFTLFGFSAAIAVFQPNQ